MSFQDGSAGADSASTPCVGAGVDVDLVPAGAADRLGGPAEQAVVVGAEYVVGAVASITHLIHARDSLAEAARLGLCPQPAFGAECILVGASPQRYGGVSDCLPVYVIDISIEIDGGMGDPGHRQHSGRDCGQSKLFGLQHNVSSWGVYHWVEPRAAQVGLEVRSPNRV